MDWRIETNSKFDAVVDDATRALCKTKRKILLPVKNRRDAGEIV